MFWLRIFLILFLLWAVNCTKPTGPVYTYGPILYAVTHAISGYSRIYYIDTATDSLVDSMLVPFQTSGLGVSPDGSKLYLTNAVIDTKKKSIINGAHTGVPTPDGRYLISTSPITPSVRIIDARTNKVIFDSDTLFLSIDGTGKPFDTQNGLVYGAYYDTIGYLPTKIGVFDYRTFRLVKVIDPAKIGGLAVPPLNIALTTDGNKLYYTAAPSFFTGIDLRRDEVVSLYLINAFSYLGMMPDNSRIYLTDPGGYKFDPPPSRLIQIYSPISEKFLTPIDISQYISSCDGYGFPLSITDQIAITSNGSKAYLSTWVGRDFLVIDTQTNTLKKVICVIGFINSLVIQQTKQ